jgi:hypothetical protein
MDIGCAGIPDNKLSGRRALRKGGLNAPLPLFISIEYGPTGPAAFNLT